MPFWGKVDTFAASQRIFVNGTLLIFEYNYFAYLAGCVGRTYGETMPDKLVNTTMGLRSTQRIVCKIFILTTIYPDTDISHFCQRGIVYR